MTQQKLIAAAQRIKELEMQIKLLQDEVDGLKKPIKEHMEKSGETEIIAGVYTISYTDVESSRFNQAGFKKANPQLFEAFVQTSSSKRFTIR